MESNKNLWLRHWERFWDRLWHLLLVHSSTELHRDRSPHSRKPPSWTRLGSLVYECSKGVFLSHRFGFVYTNLCFQGSKTGKDNGFSMLFDIESFDYSYFNEGSEGLKLALVHHLDMPIMRQKGFHIAPGTENQIAVTPTLMSTSTNAMAR